MIINEIDEKNSKNNRTIDTETGVYLKVAKTFNREHYVAFNVVDDDLTIIVETTLSRTFVDQEKI